MVTDESLPLAPGRILHAAILPWLLGGTNDDARFLASRTQSFSLLEVGASHGLYALELAARFPKGSFVHLEPNGTAWEAHTALGVSRRLPHALFLRNNITHEVAEALAHSNEFFDAQLLLSLQTTKPFDHGVEVKPSKREQLDRYVAHLLSLARRTLLLLPAPSDGRSCRDGRLATWLHGTGGGGTSERLRAASDACEADGRHLAAATLLRADAAAAMYTSGASLVRAMHLLRKVEPEDDERRVKLELSVLPMVLWGDAMGTPDHELAISRIEELATSGQLDGMVLATARWSMFMANLFVYLQANSGSWDPDLKVLHVQFNAFTAMLESKTGGVATDAPLKGPWRALEKMVLRPAHEAGGALDERRQAGRGGRGVELVRRAA